MASIFPRGNKLWIKYRPSDSAKPVRESLNLPNNPEGRKAANIKKREKEIELLRGITRRSKGFIKFSEAFSSFIERKKKETDSYEVYIYAKDALINYNDSDPYIHQLDKEFFLDLKNYLIKKKSHNTASTYLNHLKTIFAYFIEENLISSKNPVCKIQPIKMPIVTISSLDRDIIFEYFSKINPGFNKYINLLYLSGFRRSEALSLYGKNILFERKIIQVYNSKEKRWEDFPMIRNLDKYFENNIIKADERFFGYTGDYVTHYFNKHVKKLNLDIHYSLHDFRRTFGMEMARIVKPLKLKALMRHNDIRTTMKYYVDDNVL